MSHPRPHAQPTRALPARPSLDRLRKQAKRLLRSYRAGDPAAVEDVGRFECRPEPAGFALADSQRVLARSYGFPSWSALKRHVETLTVRAFCEAVDTGDVATVRRMAQARPELVGLSPDGEFGERIALHAAVLNRDAEMTRALMEAGSDARTGIWPYRAATTAHTLASERGYDEIVAIIEHEERRRQKDDGAPAALIGSRPEEVREAILRDRCEEAVRLLESDPSLVMTRTLRGETPLHLAAWAHSPELVAWLLERGADVHAGAPFEVPSGTPPSKVPGKTPLDYAAFVAGRPAHGRPSPFMENSAKDPARFDETVRLLRERGAELTPRAAIAIGDISAVRRLHDEGRLENEIHPLRGGLLSIAVRVNRPDLVALLLDLGLDPNESVAGEHAIRVSWGMPLWFAALCGRHAIAELLLDRGADVDAIVFACGDAMCMASDEVMTALLLARGARLTVEHVNDRETARAILEGRVRAGSLNVDDPSLTDLAEQMLCASAGSDPEIVRLCLPRLSRKRDDPWWNYALMKALPETTALILGHGVDPDVVGTRGQTILHHLATDHVDERTRVPRAAMLLDAGASPDRRDPLLRSTPLGWACRWGRADLVRLYLTRGADPREPEAEPWATPLSWAAKGGHPLVIELLRSHGVE